MIIQSLQSQRPPLGKWFVFNKMVRVSIFMTECIMSHQSISKCATHDSEFLWKWTDDPCCCVCDCVFLCSNKWQWWDDQPTITRFCWGNGFTRTLLTSRLTVVGLNPLWVVVRFWRNPTGNPIFDLQPLSSAKKSWPTRRHNLGWLHTGGYFDLRPIGMCQTDFAGEVPSWRSSVGFYWPSDNLPWLLKMAQSK